MLKVIQISDTHLCKNRKDRIFGLVNPDDTLYDIIELIKKEQPDIVLATGDLSQDGSIESYQRMHDFMSTLNCNVYTIPGNHDDPDNLNKFLIGKNIKNVPVLTTKLANFIFVNSHKYGTKSGYIDQHSLENLNNHLNNYNNCIIVIHHHFVPLNTMIDKYIIENRFELINTLNKHKTKIKFCITGHVHNFYTSNLDNIKIYSGVSTCIQFAKTKELLFDNKSPGFMIYQFENDGYNVIEKTLQY